MILPRGIQSNNGLARASTLLKVAAIVPAAGLGTRLGAKDRKPFVLLSGKPLIMYALKALDSSKYIEQIYVAVDPNSIGRLEDIIDRYGIRKVVKVVAVRSNPAVYPAPETEFDTAQAMPGPAWIVKTLWLVCRIEVAPPEISQFPTLNHAPPGVCVKAPIRAYPKVVAGSVTITGTVILIVNGLEFV